MPVENSSTPAPDLRVHRATALLLGLEAAAMLAGTAWVTVGSVVDPEGRLAPTVFLALIGLLVAVLLLAGARAVLRGETWSRGPVLTWQLVQGGVAMPLVLSSGWWLGLPLLLTALAVAAAILTGRVLPRPDPTP